MNLGSPNSASPRESALLDDTFSLVFPVDSFFSSGVWQNDAAKLKDG